ncbi:MAG: hypothetical protein K2G28_07640 [Acetatifactor sp.]|nr:hypothetical protein [Acetatifactor sp.]MDE7352842.1 hypothetical protein [Acetatifactor sp.]
MGAQLFDNYEEDGQLSFFGADGPEPDGERRTADEKEPDLPPGSDIRVGRCSSCGRMLMVREEAGRYLASCMNCGVSYAQSR